MSQQILKNEWERASISFNLERQALVSLLSPFTQDEPELITPLASGCANANYKITFVKKRPPLLLRIYLRDPHALQREIRLHQLVQEKIPVATIHYADNSFKNVAYAYAIMEWIEGEIMRDVILKGEYTDIADCAFSAGTLLNQLRHISLPQAGFFNPDLSIQPFGTEHTLSTLFNLCCNEPSISHFLGDSLLQALEHYIRKHENLLLSQMKANLAHADFDPSNILVKRTHDAYQVVALLDWEFALADSYLLDMGLFLRYSHRLPRIYRDSFIQGIENQAETLPQHWEISIQLKEILCLLSLLYDNRHQTRPNMTNDVKSLLQDIVDT